MEKTRIDKWLWAVRIFKSRTIASDACRTGKVKAEGDALKPSYLVSTGEIISVKKNGFNFLFKVITLLDKRVGAPVAQTCYEDLTSQEELNKYKDWFVGKGGTERREKGAGRPTKRERRLLDDYKEPDSE